MTINKIRRFVVTAGLGAALIGGATLAVSAQDRRGDRKDKGQSQEQTRDPNRQKTDNGQQQQQVQQRDRQRQIQDQQQQQQQIQQRDRQRQIQDQQNQQNEARMKEDRARQLQQQQQNQNNQDWRNRDRTGRDNSSSLPQQQIRDRERADRLNNRNDNRYQQWSDRYQSNRDQQDRFFRDRERQLEQQRRRNQLSYQNSYFEQLRRDQLRLQSWRYNNYANDYRYNRGGQYFYTSSYGADLLRRAVNEGYAQGFNAGLADRNDRWQFSPQDSFGYQDATYGYDGYYADVSDYQYYFREGFQRGYDDGYNDRYQYGRRANSGLAIAADVLNAIIQIDRY